MAGAKPEKTRWPGIYKRGGRYMYVWTDGQRKRRRETVRTLEEARAGKRQREEEARYGVARAVARETFAEYAIAWADRYQGRGRNGFRENTRAEYRRDLERYAIAHFGRQLRVTEVTPRHIADLVAWLCDDAAQRRRHAREVADRSLTNTGRAREHEARRRRNPLARVDDLALLPALRVPSLPLADATVRRILCPVRACLATAVREGLITSNPATGAALPHRPAFDGEDPEDVKALTPAQLCTFLLIVHPRYRLLFEVLAATGLRISEALALQWRYLVLDGERPHVRVRRAYVRGVMGPPKSRHGRREVPISPELVTALRAARAAGEWPRPDDLVFPAVNGGILDQSNLRRDALVPAAQEAGVAWAGFHTFRHTCASTLFERGRNAKQVQRWLGHHSPSYTLATYVHLLDDDLGEPLAPPTSTGEGERGGNTPHREHHRNEANSE